MFPTDFFCADFFTPNYWPRPVTASVVTGRGFRGAGKRFLHVMMMERDRAGEHANVVRLTAIRQLSERLATRAAIFDMEQSHQKRLTESAMYSVLLSEL